MPDVVIRQNPERHRYEAWSGESAVGHTKYRLTDGVVVFTHTEVEPEHRGQGIAGRMIRFALDDVRARDLHVVAKCPKVRSWINKHPDYQDLLAGSRGGGPDPR